MNFVRLNAATFTDPTDWALEVAATTSASSAPPSIRFCSRAEQWPVVSPKRPTTAIRPRSTRPTTSLAAAISVLRTTPTPSPLPQLPALPHWATAKLRWLTAKWNEQNLKLTVVPALACYWFNIEYYNIQYCLYIQTCYSTLINTTLIISSLPWGWSKLLP